MTTPTEYQTEAAVVRDLAELATEPHDLQPGSLVQITVPEGGTSITVDLERYADVPARRRGTVVVYDAPSFLAYVGAQHIDGTTVYTDVLLEDVTAVINGHESVPSGEPGWGDHRAQLKLRQTPEWKAWVGFCGTMRPQAAFAEFIEDHLVDIFEPAGALMLELAQKFEATTGVDFKTSAMLDSGERRLTYEETINASASNGTIDIPKQVTLGLKAYEGGVAYKVTARFRFRINNGNLQLGLILDNPEKVLEQAFADVVTDVKVGLPDGVLVLSGAAAASLHPGYPR